MLPLCGTVVMQVFMLVSGIAVKVADKCNSAIVS